MTVILAVDTSTEACSVALLCDGKISSDFVISQREHTQKVLPMIDNLLHAANCRLADLDAIAFGQGPGSFTGVRIGIAIAQGLAFGANKPLIGVSSLMTLAQGVYRKTGAVDVIPAIDARMNEVYLGHYVYQEERWYPQINECVVRPESVQTLISSSQNSYVAGTGWQTYPEMLPNIKDGELFLPEAQDLVVIAEKMWLNNETIMVEDVEPIYLRNEVTWKKLPGR